MWPKPKAFPLLENPENLLQTHFVCRRGGLGGERKGRRSVPWLQIRPQVNQTETDTLLYMFITNILIKQRYVTASEDREYLRACQRFRVSYRKQTRFLVKSPSVMTCVPGNAVRIKLITTLSLCQTLSPWKKQQVSKRRALEQFLKPLFFSLSHLSSSLLLYNDNKNDIPLKKAGSIAICNPSVTQAQGFPPY